MLTPPVCNSDRFLDLMPESLKKNNKRTLIILVVTLRGRCYFWPKIYTQLVCMVYELLKGMIKSLTSAFSSSFSSSLFFSWSPSVFFFSSSFFFLSSSSFFLFSSRSLRQTPLATCPRLCFWRTSAAELFR